MSRKRKKFKPNQKVIKMDKIKQKFRKKHTKRRINAILPETEEKERKGELRGSLSI